MPALARFTITRNLICACLLFLAPAALQAAPILTLNKEVSIDSTNWFDSITIQAPVDVYYRYTARFENPAGDADITASVWSLSDDKLGQLVVNAVVAAGPFPAGNHATYRFVTTAFISQTTTNIADAEWFYEGTGFDGVARAQDSATVTLQDATVPSPGTLVLMGMGLAFAGLSRRRASR